MTPERARRIARLHTDLAAEYDAWAAAIPPPVAPPPTTPPTTPPPQAPVRPTAATTGPTGTLTAPTPGGRLTGEHQGVWFAGPVELVGAAALHDCRVDGPLSVADGATVTITRTAATWLGLRGGCHVTASRLRVIGGANADAWRIAATDDGPATRPSRITVTDSYFATSASQQANHVDVLQVRGVGDLTIQRCALELVSTATRPQYPWNSVLFLESPPPITGSVLVEDCWLLGGGSWKAVALSTAGVATTLRRLRISTWWRDAGGAAVMHTERPDGTPRPDTSTWRWVRADAPDVDAGPI